jgi:hypothetical protein
MIFVNFHKKILVCPHFFDHYAGAPAAGRDWYFFPQLQACAVYQQDRVTNVI